MTESERRGEYDIVIAGAGPAGSSLAIRLGRKGAAVCIVEKESFPRHKLCGEFISPECLEHFRSLGVLDEMLSSGGDLISETVFFSASGRRVAVPSSWFGGLTGRALSLSRLKMDEILLRRAVSAGARVIEGSAVCDLEMDGDRIISVLAKDASGGKERIRGTVIVDATGRSRAVAKLVSRRLRKAKPGGGRAQTENPGAVRSGLSGSEKLVGFKTHFDGVDMKKGVCEIYFFPGGYGGLSWVEGGAANHCFLVKAGAVKEFGGDADKILRELVFRNQRARVTLADARRMYKWHAVAIDRFGPKSLAPAQNMFTVGDAAAFIDPFTGSGMLIALESSRLLAEAVFPYLDSPVRAAEVYLERHAGEFGTRMRVCSLLRRLAFVPSLAGTAIFSFGLSARARRFVARTTRSGGVSGAMGAGLE